MSAGGSNASSEGGPAGLASVSPNGAEAPPEAVSEPASEAAPQPSRTGRPPAAMSARTITDLELAFAENPKSDVYVELCHAYLEKRRFMEAMVVCKKAGRSDPEAIAPKLLLARVHESQGRLPKARDVLAPLYEQHGEDPAVATSFGRVQLASGNEAEGIAALKHALDLDPTWTEAADLLKGRGVTYSAGPPPVPPPDSASGGPAPAGSEAAPQDTGNLLTNMPVVQAPPPAWGPAPGVPPQGPMPGGPMMGVPPQGPMAGGPMALGAVVPPGAYAGAASGVYRVPPQRLEGEDELERIAESVAAEKPHRGRGWTTILLLVALILGGGAVVGLRVVNKIKVEEIDRLSREAVTAFDRDLYASYKRAASALEEILEHQDPEHPKTLARLSHIYAILLTEHLERGIKGRFEAVLAKAETRAAGNPHTVAARGLYALADGSDRTASASRAVDVLSPEAAPDQTTVPTFVDLALGIAEIERARWTRPISGCVGSRTS